MVAGVDSASDEDDPSFTADRLTIVFTSDRNGNDDIFIGTRPDPDGDFIVVPADTVNSLDDESSPELSADGTTLLFTSSRSGEYDVYTSTRPPGGVFGVPTRVPALSGTSTNENDVALSPDGLTVLVVRGSAFLRARRASPGDAWDPPVAIAGVAFGTSPSAPSLDAAGDIYFQAGGSQRDIFLARVQGASYADAVPVTELATSERESGPCVSADETYMMFARSGQIMESTRD